MDALKITCDVQNRANYTSLLPVQGELKSLSVESYEKLKKSILKHGIHSPIFVWDHDNKLNILDGHQRVRAYGQLEKEGFVIPPVPIVKIQASDIKKAKEILLTLVSQYGKINSDGLYEFANEAGLEFPDLKEYDFPDFDIYKFESEFFKEIQEAELPDLATGEKTPFQQVTFTLHDTQKEVVESAMVKAIAMGAFDQSVNENKNGNAISRICEVFLQYMAQKNG